MLDYLKFDVESSEWSSLEAMFDEGSISKVKQVTQKSLDTYIISYFVNWLALFSNHFFFHVFLGNTCILRGVSEYPGKVPLIKCLFQIAMEVHWSGDLGRKGWERYHTILERLERVWGFRKWSSHANPKNLYTSSVTHKRRSRCYELVYVNSNFG